MAGAVFSNGLRAPYIHADSRVREKAFEYPKENTMENDFRARKKYPVNTGEARCHFLVRTPLFGVLDNRFAVLWCAVPHLSDMPGYG